MSTLWYVCKFCQRAFQQPKKLVEHKRDNHGVMKTDIQKDADDNSLSALRPREYVSLKRHGHVSTGKVIRNEKQTVENDIDGSDETERSSTSSCPEGNQSSDSAPKIKSPTIKKRRRHKKMYYSSLHGKTYRCKCRKTYLTSYNLKKHQETCQSYDSQPKPIQQPKVGEKAKQKSSKKSKEIKKTPSPLIATGKALRSTSTLVTMKNSDSDTFSAIMLRSRRRR